VQVFGRVTAGMDTVRRIEGVKTTRSDFPVEEIRIVNVTVT
jgi:cyclophilin family peptidyl-prolyl cis-trans isomerase